MGISVFRPACPDIVDAPRVPIPSCVLDPTDRASGPDARPSPGSWLGAYRLGHAWLWDRWSQALHYRFADPEELVAAPRAQLGVPVRLHRPAEPYTDGGVEIATAASAPTAGPGSSTFA
jgi:hypothetical protein